MQRLFNFMAVASFIVTTTQVLAIFYLVNNQDKYINQVRDTVMEEVTGLIPELVQSSMTEGLATDETLGNFNVGTPF